MMHMRPYNAFETKNIKFLVNKSIDFTTLEITETGLRKSIMDATAPVRTYLKDKGIHDYSAQQQGIENKRLINTILLTEYFCHQTKTSLYRPITKKGDPRLWVNKVSGLEFLHANDIFALMAYNGILYAVNLTQVDISKTYHSAIVTPMRDIIDKISIGKRSVSEELLGLIREKMTEWQPVEIMADTGIGRTIESILGIPMNASREPDYKGIELKSHRRNSSVRNMLFTQVPNWEISRYKNGREIVEDYGYYTDDGRSKTLHITLTANKPNNQKLGLFVNHVEEILEVDEFCLQQRIDGSYHKIQDVVVWELPLLHERLLTKHRETFWIDVETKVVQGKEFFRCSTIEHTKNPLVHQFDTLLDQGDIQVDLLLCRPSGHGDNYSFKIKPRMRPLLFPKSDVYKLIQDR